MSYRSETIATAIGRMNRQYFLPAIQREFVWKPEQIAQLFDSIMRGYPISSFLFWELNPENRDKWQVYKFLEKASHGGTHNQLAHTDGLPNLALVLDGQQRLTSLLIGLRGTYVAKKKYKRWDNPDAWSDQRLSVRIEKAVRVVEQHRLGVEVLERSRTLHGLSKRGRILEREPFFAQSPAELHPHAFFTSTDSSVALIDQHEIAGLKRFNRNRFFLALVGQFVDIEDFDRSAREEALAVFVEHLRLKARGLKFFQVLPA